MLISSRNEFDHMVNRIRSSDTVVFDTEATGLYLRHGDKTIGISIYIPGTSESFYFAWGHGTKPFNADYEALKRWSNEKKRAYAFSVYRDHFLKDVLRENMPEAWLQDLREVWTPDKLYIGHNIQYDLTAFRLLGFPTPTKIADTMSMVSVVCSDWRGDPKKGYYPVFPMPDGTHEKGSRGLKWQARLWNLTNAQQGIGELEDAVLRLEENLVVMGGERATLGMTKDTPAQEFLWMLKPSETALYAEDDVRLTWGLYEKCLKFSEGWGDRHIHDLYNRITLAVWHMSDNGFRLDMNKAAEVIDHGEKEITDLQERIKTLTGGRIENPDSPAQVTTYLQSEGYDVIASNKKVLKKVEDNPAVRSIEDLRHVSKLLNTYVKSWYENAVYDFIYPELNVGGTGTARLSSSSKKFGNMQNVPKSSAKGSVNPKALLYPPKGCIILDLDYQALEGRLGAWIAETIIGKGESLVLTNLIENGVDLHSYTMEVSGIYGLLLNGRTEEQFLIDSGYDMSKIDDPVVYFREKVARAKAKTANFAAQYGAGWKGIQRAVECSKEEAEILLEGYHRAYPAIGKAMDYLQKLAVKPRPLPNGGTVTKTVTKEITVYDNGQITEDGWIPKTEKTTETYSGRVGQYVIYPLPEVALRRKYHYYPTSQVNSYGGTFSPLQMASRGAFNSVTQGCGGLLVLNSILRIQDKYGFASYEVIDGERVYDFSTGLVIPNVTVHDSLVLSLRPCDLHIVPDILKLMEDYPTRPKLEVEASAAPIGGSWAETRKIKDMELWISSEGKEGF